MEPKSRLSSVNSNCTPTTWPRQWECVIKQLHTYGVLEKHYVGSVLIFFFLYGQVHKDILKSLVKHAPEPVLHLKHAWSNSNASRNQMLLLIQQVQNWVNSLYTTLCSSRAGFTSCDSSLLQGSQTWSHTAVIRTVRLSTEAKWSV